jgi:4-amino-4-deoxy-L-arabinose transferase-like glycosyltransferase
VSAAESHWPAWLRRRTGVEFLGPPNLFFARLTIALSLGAILYVGAWNAAKYPLSLGFDAQPNAAYIHILLDQHHIPHPDQSGEANQPPAYYFVAGVAARLGHKIFHWSDTGTFPGFPEASFRGAQCLNVLLVFLTALCVLWLARLVAPNRPWVWAASVGFFAFLPVVSKTEAMIHPENLNLLFSAVAMTAMTDMLVRRRFRRRMLVLLGASIGLGLATRPSMLFIILALLLGSVIAASDITIRRVVPWRRLAAVAAAVLVVATPWVAYRAIVQDAGPLNRTGALIQSALHPTQHLLSDRLTSHAHFFDFSPEVFTMPWRTHFTNQAPSETYVEIWGDWLASFAWSAYSGEPSPAAKIVLRDQSYIGFLPTVFAVVGWFWLLGASLRARRELAPLAFIPLFAVGGYLYRSYAALSHDGDLLKALYALNTAPVWALSFGLVTVWVASKSRLARYGLMVLFAAFAILELRFMLYGIRDGHPIF